MAAVNTAFFLAFAGCLFGGACAVMLSRDRVRAALFLLLAAVSCAALCALLGHQYLALFLVAGYACTTVAMLGLIALCFAGSSSDDQNTPAFWRPAALGLGLILVVELVVLVMLGGDAIPQAASPRPTEVLNPAKLAQYWVQALLAGLVVLTALVGAAVIAFRQDVAETDFNAYEPDEGLVLKDVARGGDGAQ